MGFEGWFTINKPTFFIVFFLIIHFLDMTFCFLSYRTQFRTSYNLKIIFLLCDSETVSEWQIYIWLLFNILLNKPYWTHLGRVKWLLVVLTMKADTGRSNNPKKLKVMNLLKSTLFVLAIAFSFSMQAQKQKSTTEVKMDKKTYYQKRAEEDAKFEQQFKAENKAEEKSFWKEQKAYEKNLKKTDKQAYKAYIQGKHDAYAEHYEHCNHHCHHGDYYYNYASYYYYRHNSYYSRRSQQRSLNTRVNVSTPSVRLGVF